MGSEPNASPPDTTAGWRRTNCGWQRVESLGPPPQSERPTLHPAIVGGLEILLTLTALVAFSSGESAREASCETPRNPSGGTRSVPDTLP
jgi:hypothetical protein